MDMAAKVASAIARLPKEPIIYRNVTQRTYDPTTGSKGSHDTANSQDAVVSNYSARDIDGTRVQANDREFIFQTTAFAVKEGGRIEHAGDHYTVISFEHVAAAGVWIAQGRR